MNTVTQTQSSSYDKLNAAVESIGMKSVHYRIILLVAAGSLFNVIEQYNIGFAVPLIIAEWGISPGEAGLLSSVTFASMAISSLASGKLADRFGRKPIFMWNVALFTVGALVAALAPNYAVLLIGRIVVGIGLGGEMALGFTIIAELIPTKRRGSAAATISLLQGGVGIFAAAGLAALILGPLSAALGGDRLTWRFLLGVMFLPAVLILFYRRYIPESPRYLLKTGRIDELNRTLSLLSINRLRAKEQLTVTNFVDAGAVVPASMVVRTRELFQRGRVKVTCVAWLMATCLFGTVATATIFVPLVLVDAGYSSGTAAAIATLINFGGLLGALLGIACAHRIPRRRVGLGTGILAVAAALVLTQPLSTAAIVAVAFTLIFILEVMAGSFWGYVPELYSTRLRGFGTGTAVTVALLVGATASPILGGSLYSSGGCLALFTFLAVLCLVYAVSAWNGPETHGKHLLEES